MSGVACRSREAKYWNDSARAAASVDIRHQGSFENVFDRLGTFGNRPSGKEATFRSTFGQAHRTYIQM